MNKTLQGNLDPSLLLAPWDVLEKRVKAILDEGMQRVKYMFTSLHSFIKYCFNSFF
jgi:uroporphyrinogen decarboxylase